MPDELLVYYVDTPVTLPPKYTAFGLGETYRPGGRLAGWSAAQAEPLFAPSNNAWIQVALLEPDGTITGAAPLKPGHAVSLYDVLTSGMHRMPVTDGMCPVNGLSSWAKMMAQLPESDGLFREAEWVQWPFSTEPVRSYQRLNTDLRAYTTDMTSASVHLVYVEEDVKIMGQQRCISGTINGRYTWIDQGNIQVNMTLTRGWNALLRRVTPSEVGEMTVLDIEWATLAPDALERRW